MAKRKLTPEILEQIELCASDVYTIDDIREEVNLQKALMNDVQVVSAIKRGRVQWLIEIFATNGDLESFLFHTDISMDKCNEMVEENKMAIEARKKELAKEDEEKKKRMEYNAMYSLSPFSQLLNQRRRSNEKINDEAISDQNYYDEFIHNVNKAKQGENKYLFSCLMSQMNQLQYLSGTINNNIYGEVGKSVENFTKLIELQIKLMQEQRRTVMAFDQLMNPKKTVFVKKAEQHNHLHQESEKKYENGNELQKELDKPDSATDAEVYVPMEKSNEKE